MGKLVSEVLHSQCLRTSMVDFGYASLCRKSICRCVWTWCQMSESCIVKPNLSQKNSLCFHTGAVHPKAQNAEEHWLKKPHWKGTWYTQKCVIQCFSMNIFPIFDKIKRLNVRKDYPQFLFSYPCLLGLSALP